MRRRKWPMMVEYIKTFRKQGNGMKQKRMETTVTLGRESWNDDDDDDFMFSFSAILLATVISYRYVQQSAKSTQLVNLHRFYFGRKQSTPTV